MRVNSPSGQMGTAAIVEVLCLLPVEGVVIFITVMTMILDIASLIVSNKCIMIVSIACNGCRETSFISLITKSGTKRFVNVVAISQNGLIGWLREITSFVEFRHE